MYLQEDRAACCCCAINAEAIWLFYDVEVHENKEVLWVSMGCFVGYEMLNRPVVW